MNPDKFPGYVIRWTVPTGDYAIYSFKQHGPQLDPTESQIEKALAVENFADADAVIARIKAKL